MNEKLSKLIIQNSKYVAVNAQLNASNIGFHTISKYKNADLVIINENEMRHEMRDKSSELNYLIKKLAKKINSKIITVTSGDQGSTSYNKKINKVFNCPAFASKVVDKIGAGDTMLAVLSLAIHKKANIKFSMFLSALAAAINVQSEANSLVLNRVDMIKSIQSYLKIKMSDIKKVLVTGGGGYVGSSLIPKLLEANFEINVLDLYDLW